MKNLFVYAIRKSNGCTFCITKLEALRDPDIWNILQAERAEIEEVSIVDNVTEIIEEISIPIKKKGSQKKG